MKTLDSYIEESISLDMKLNEASLLDNELEMVRNSNTGNCRI